MIQPIKVTEVKITRLEGRSDECIEHTFNSLESANLFLKHREYSYPKLGYDKHRFLVTWEDGQTYDGRMDAVHPENEFYSQSRHNLGKQMMSFLQYLDQDGHPTALNFAKTHIMW